ncbi:expressed conserved protein [Echinococcus multilocularis]|uniref:Expressed conserved protein n=1 Tax=Echinococcus multilocularis TaxID=6211 RepID=A0A087VYL1_ECHMU|nr:expressed conserved protein [Echinococcus multilocularis]
MGDEYRDDYGNYVVNNYNRNRELAAKVAAEQTAQPCSPSSKQWSASAHTRTPMYPQRMVYMPVPGSKNQTGMQYRPGMQKRNQGWPSLRDEPDYLSLDSDSDSSSCSGSSSSTCHCSSCGGTITDYSSTSSSGCCSASYDYTDARQRSKARSPKRRNDKSRSRGRREKCDCDSSVFSVPSLSSSTCSPDRSRNRKCVSPRRKDERSSKGKSRNRCSVCHKPLDNIREKKVLAAQNLTSPSCTPGESQKKPAQRRYHRCKTPRVQMPCQCTEHSSSYINGRFRGVNTEIRPGPPGNGFFTEEDVIRKHNLVYSDDNAYPKPDLLLYPASTFVAPPDHAIYEPDRIRMGNRPSY